MNTILEEKEGMLVMVFSPTIQIYPLMEAVRMSCQKIGRIGNMLHNFKEFSKSILVRCYFVQKKNNCQDVAGFVNYVSILYCTFGKSLFPIGVSLYIAWLIFLFIAVGASSEDYLCPSIEIISKSLR